MIIEKEIVSNENHHVNFMQGQFADQYNKVVMFYL